METNDLTLAIAEIHNRLTEISVRGDDAIRMAEVLRMCRSLVTKINRTDGGTNGTK